MRRRLAKKILSRPWRYSCNRGLQACRRLYGRDALAWLSYTIRKSVKILEMLATNRSKR